MQTIVKILIAFFFSHFSVSDTNDDKKQEDTKVSTSFIIKNNSCVSNSTSYEEHLI